MTDETNTENYIQEQNQEGTIEEDFALLDRLAEKLEDSNISLEESFRLYQQGMQLLKKCSDRIDLVEKKMLQISEDGVIDEF